eukprot:379919-Rhodomonas_salina.1
MHSSSGDSDGPEPLPEGWVRKIDTESGQVPHVTSAAGPGPAAHARAPNQRATTLLTHTVSGPCAFDLGRGASGRGAWRRGR